MISITVGNEEDTMTLEKVDIKEVLSDAAEGKLQLVHQRKPQFNETQWLEEKVRILEDNFGDLKAFEFSGGGYLFPIELCLNKTEHKELKRRWDTAIKLSTKIRLQKLRGKALDMLENFDNETKAPVNTFCRIILADVLSENTERIKAQYGYRPPSHVPDDREADDLQDQLEMRED
jgi:hypothetical protein